MLLGGKTIIEEVNNGNIMISPFDSNRVGPNSYNLSLDNKLLVYGPSVIDRLTGDGVQPYIPEYIIDMKKDNPTSEIIIPEEGLILEPGIVYLGKTKERTFTEKYVPKLEGRSSTGRLGLLIHVTAGLGDIGFDGYWTLELAVMQRLRIYPGAEVCQVCFETVSDNTIKYNGKYQNNDGIQASRMYRDFELK